MTRKRKSLLRLAFRLKPFWTGHRQTWQTHYLTRFDGEYLYRYYPKEDIIEKIPVKPIALTDLGLKSLPSGKIIPICK